MITPRKQRVAMSGRKMFAAFVLTIAPIYLLLILDRAARSDSRNADTVQHGLFDRCLEICRSYGLITSGDIADDAEAYLAAVESRPLSDDLQTLLVDATFTPAASQQHPLLQQRAPVFVLSDHLDDSHSLAALNRKGPVVVVFYYGYWCSHCVAQLFALNKDLQHFTDIGATVVAISADPTEQTLARFVQYGKFDFPVLSDPENSVAERYCVFRPAADDKEPQLDHGTFVVDGEGRIVWAYQGTEPFMDNRTLLTILANIQNRRPISKSAAAGAD